MRLRKCAKYHPSSTALRKRAKHHLSSTASPDKETPSKYQALTDQLRVQPHVEKNFLHIRHEQPCGHTEEVEAVMEYVLLFTVTHTNSGLRYCAEEIRQDVDEFSRASTAY